MRRKGVGYGDFYCAGRGGVAGIARAVCTIYTGLRFYVGFGGFGVDFVRLVGYVLLLGER